MQPQQPAEGIQPTMKNPLSVLQPGEKTLFELKRHSIGIVGMYIMTAVVLLIVGVIALVVAPHYITAVSSSQVRVFGGLVFGIFALLCLAFNYINTVVYWGNKWILTDDSITQIDQTSLFKKQTSQLELESLEDVTAEQNGILPRLLNYGLLTVETAGHHSKFVFPYCPNPNHYAQSILEAREVEAREQRTLGPREDTPPQNPVDPGINSGTYQ